MADPTVLTLIDGVRIVVPDSLDLITPYVLREQQDFFEDEMRFVRELLRTGQNVIDIGANYGVYALPMARKVGVSGHVWAFEPASSTARFLALGVAANGFENITLVQSAVSNAQGSANLSLQRHPELNSIIHGSVPPGPSETVSLVTLDDCMDHYGWKDIEFIKIDAEGEEANIVEGGRRFLATVSPLVQYELRKNAAAMNFDLIRDFAVLGYESYRYLPGLNLLVPFQSGSQTDPYLLNLFCCNTERANRLAARSLLLRSTDVARTGGLQDEPASRNAVGAAHHHWRRALAHMAYAAPLFQEWGLAEEAGESAEVHQALSFYARSRDEALSMAERFCALGESFSQFKMLCAREPSRLRLASLARVAHDYGERALAVNALTQLLESIHRAGSVDPNEPFLAPLERFDSIAPGESVAKWLLGAALEHLEQRERFSSFYAGSSARERLEIIHVLGFGSPEMERRLELVRLRFGPASQPQQT